LQVVGQPFLIRTSTPEVRPYLFSFFFTSTVAAGALGSSAGGALQELFARLSGSPVAGYRLALAASALASGIGAIALLGVTRSEPAGPAGATLLSTLRLREPARVALLALPEAIIGLGAGMTIPFLQLYFRNEFHQGSFAIGAIYTAGSLGMALGYAVSPAFARRFGPRWVIVGSQLLSIVFLVELAFPAGLSFAIVSFVLRTSLMNLNAPVLSQFALEMAHPDDQRAVSSTLSLVRGVTWAIAGSLGGWLIDRRHGDFSLTIVSTAILYVVAAAVGARAYGFLERTKPRT
jgi:predicted MFS family arabinose efflux permease